LWFKPELLAEELAVIAKLHFVASLISILNRNVQLRIQRKEKLPVFIPYPQARSRIRFIQTG
jgi:hypothetical protein